MTGEVEGKEPGPGHLVLVELAEAGDHGHHRLHARLLPFRGGTVAHLVQVQVQVQGQVQVQVQV